MTRKDFKVESIWEVNKTMEQDSTLTRDNCTSIGKEPHDEESRSPSYLTGTLY
jgi:hypothetical protein